MAAKCSNRKPNTETCTCTYLACDRRGFCCACITYHREKGQLPGCVFPTEAEKTYDRSVRHYVQVMQAKA
jgi:hypothetical protein